MFIVCAEALKFFVIIYGLFRVTCIAVNHLMRWLGYPSYKCKSIINLSPAVDAHRIPMSANIKEFNEFISARKKKRANALQS